MDTRRQAGGDQITMIRIGLFSEDTKLQPLISSALGKEFQIVLKSSEESLRSALASGDCDIAILDLDSNHGSLKDRIASARRLVVSEIPAVIMADDGQRAVATELVRLGAHGYCRKPPAIRDLKALLLRTYENSSMRRKLETAQQQIEEASRCDRMIGGSPAMQQVYDLIRRVTGLNASVLVTGESGTGKELIASAIHNLGNRADKPFVAVSCGAIPETLIESELFGHEKGAYTGTVGSREGFLEQARDGTLFLDEIGELSLNVQVKLLRVLQQREFCRLGSSKLIPLRARLVFATHRDLGQMVLQGKFRQDLYYRINVIRIDAPPLQDHAEDIPAIASHFLRSYSEQYEKPMSGFHPQAMNLLQQYAWPGNVRELENVVQRAIIMAHTDLVRADDLPRAIHEQGVVSINDFHSTGTFDLLLRDYKVKLAVDAVKENHGNKTLAARSLSISRAYLHRLIRLGDPDSIETVPEQDADSSDSAIA
jgi:DNA-binding NtrC family response regulator